MNRILFTISILLLSTSFCFPQTRAKITGTITDCETGNPLEGVAITADESDPVYTDVDGNYTLNITNGTYNLLMEKEDYLSLFMFQIDLSGLMTIDTCLGMDYPSLSVSPDEIFTYILPGSTIWEWVTLSNYGSSVVSWHSVVEYGNDSDWKNYDWLSSLDQMNGIVMPGEYMELEFEINPSNLTYCGIYDATVYFYYGDGNFVKELHISIDYNWVSIEEIHKDICINVTPNPAESYISFNNQSAGCCYIYNIDGKLITKYFLKSSKASVNIEKLLPGTYILKLEDEEYNVSVGKFVKK